MKQGTTPEKTASSVIEYFHDSGNMKSRDWAPSFLAISAFSKTKLKLTSKAVLRSQEKAEAREPSIDLLDISQSQRKEDHPVDRTEVPY